MIVFNSREGYEFDLIKEFVFDIVSVRRILEKRTIEGSFE
jgi:hypothetical protein